jgi:hypothetical protein
MTYQLTQGDTILRITDGASIPPDPANTDYAAYLEWVEAGNTPDPAPILRPAQVHYPHHLLLACRGRKSQNRHRTTATPAG